VPLDRFLASAPRDLRRSLAQLVDERLHALPAARENVGFPLDMRGQDAHEVSVPTEQAGAGVSTSNWTNPPKSTTVRPDCG
jgi:hypothetical protein